MANGKTDAMAPKRNAAPAMPAQSLSTTIQNVIKKAVTSPSDPKIDFAQGVNHITGDAHQKRAGKADSMQTFLNKEMEIRMTKRKTLKLNMMMKRKKN